MELYQGFREVPESAQKRIEAGRLKGKTDINPMWRIKALTERFGPCGSGWKYDIVSRDTLAGANGEVAAFVDILLSYKTVEGWSEPIPGTGGLLIKSITAMDNPLVQILVLLYGALSVLGVFLGDIVVSFVDPRIKLVGGNDD